MKISRQSVKCLVCGARFMSELDARATAEAHSAICERWQARLAHRIKYATQARLYGDNPATIEASERYQIRAMFLQFQPVKGFVNVAVKCDARCTGARGHNCECQCGGVNHGSANAVSGGMAA